MSQAVFNPGRMNHPIQIQVKAQTKDSHGATDETWTLVHDTYASFEYAGGRAYRVKIRWLPGINNEMRVIRPDGTIYRIVTPVDMSEKRQFLMLMCEERDRCKPVG